MRILLFACYSSIAVKDDALMLDARGYDVVTWFDLHQKGYRLNRNMPASDAQGRQNMAVELLENTQAVMHPEATPEQVQLISTMCRAFGCGLVRMEDLPFCACDASGERMDALNMLDAVEREADTARIRFQTPEPKAYRTVNEVLAQYPAGSVVILEHVERRTMWRQLWNTLCTLERRANALLGDALKNPMVREQHRPMPYVLDTSPPLVTG
jgi:hypothetical protein